ncbi:MAG: flippase-like domain-containing protein, partial [Verrucomicrobiota bacterium]|nr:flippase-like domain-containing protein [Verrucomicrobiota bacterium]
MSVKKKIWSLGWRLAVCGLLLLWIFHSIFLNEGRLVRHAQGLDWEKLSRGEQWKIGWSIGPAELGRTLWQVHPVAFLLSLVLMGLIILLGVLRWRITLAAQGLHLPMRRALAISFIAHFFNSFLLGSTGGDLIKAYYAARETHHKKTQAVVTVFVDRLIGLWAMLIFAGVMMLPNQELLFQHDDLRHWALIILLMLM